MSTILAIETSCDETAIAVVEATGNETAADFIIRGNAILSQIELHRPFGGVFPTLAKREHAKNLVPIISAALQEAGMLNKKTPPLTETHRKTITKILEREQGLAEQFLDFITKTERPNIDVISVTAGPGLEPALWVGVNFAKALAYAWDIPLIKANHMEGHILSALARRVSDNVLSIRDTKLPVLALLISGGHTEIVVMNKWLSYALVGQTRDDAVGEAFDKVARLLGLPYPGGPEISKLAETARADKVKRSYTLPRPMLKDDTCDFSFAGLKTAVLYLLKDNPKITDTQKISLAREFEDSVTDVLIEKTKRALKETSAKTLVLGGGVSANMHIRRTFSETIANTHPNVSLHIPNASLTTDNAIMIALSGFYHALNKEFTPYDELIANGNAHLAASD